MKRTRSAVALAGAALAVTAMLGTVMLGSPAAVSASTNVQCTTITWWTWTSNPKTVIANFEKAYPEHLGPGSAGIRLRRNVLRQAHHRRCRRHRPLRNPG